jgi:hypothetical protein
LVGAVLLLEPAAAAGAAEAGFVTLDRMDDATRVGAQVGLHDSDLNPEGGSLRAELHGQWLFTSRRLGLYGQLPMSYVWLPGGSNEAALQNLELGGFKLLGTSERLLVLRGGVTLPTAESGRGLSANASTLFERLVDMPALAPDSVWLRTSGSAVIRLRDVVLRSDLGLSAQAAGPTVLNGRVLAYANLGAALLSELATLTVELVNVGSLDGRGGFATRLLHTISAGARTKGSRTQAHFGVVIPLDSPERGNLWIFSATLSRSADRS